MATVENFDVVVLGAGAAGMMAAIEAGRRGRSVLVVDHADAPGEKIRISGGGRCNFTNIHTAPANFLSANPHFCKSALSRYKPADFIALVNRYHIAFHEKALGQLFCDGSAKAIIEMLLAEMEAGRSVLRLETSVQAIDKTDSGFTLKLNGVTTHCASLVVATGGKSIPKMGATGFAYEVARKFGLRVTETRPALVPLTFEAGLLQSLNTLAGVSVEAKVKHGKTAFQEGLLFTHRGLSGPSVLQISSYWREGDAITVDMAPGTDILDVLKVAKRENAKRQPVTVLAAHLPRRLAELICDGHSGNMADMPDKAINALAAAVNSWTVKPVGSEGYRTAEVTLGGIDTRDLDSRTLAARDVPGLFFVGEAVDVTGWLGGFNFQWAWASGWSAGQAA
jgi:predicted Rossmann fold flavoprotein